MKPTFNDLLSDLIFDYCKNNVTENEGSISDFYINLDETMSALTDQLAKLCCLDFDQILMDEFQSQNRVRNYFEKAKLYVKNYYKE